MDVFFTLSGFLITTLLVLYFSMSGISALESQLRAKGLATVRYLAPISEYGIIAGQMDSIYGLVQAAMQEPGVKAAIIVNPKGRTLAVSGRTPRQPKKASAACSASMPRPSARRTAPCPRANARKGVSPLPYIMS